MWKKKSRSYDVYKPFAPLKRELNTFFQHFQAWEWVEYSDFCRLLKVSFGFQNLCLRTGSSSPLGLMFDHGCDW